MSFTSHGLLLALFISLVADGLSPSNKMKRPTWPEASHASEWWIENNLRNTATTLWINIRKLWITRDNLRPFSLLLRVASSPVWPIHGPKRKSLNESYLAEFGTWQIRRISGDGIFQFCITLKFFNRLAHHSGCMCLNWHRFSAQVGSIWINDVGSLFETSFFCLNQR